MSTPYVNAVMSATIRPLATKGVAMCLAHLANKDGRVIVSQSELATLADTSVRTVRHHMKALQDAGILSRTGKKTWSINLTPLPFLHRSEIGKSLPVSGAQMAPRNRQNTDDFAALHNGSIPATHCRFRDSKRQPVAGFPYPIHSLRSYCGGRSAKELARKRWCRLLGGGRS